MPRSQWEKSADSSFLWWVDIKLYLCWCQPWRQQGITETGHTASLGSEPKRSGEGFEYTLEKVRWSQVCTLVEAHVGINAKSLRSCRAKEGPVSACTASSLGVLKNVGTTRRKTLLANIPLLACGILECLLLDLQAQSLARQRCNNLPHLANCAREWLACLHLTAAGTD